MNTTKGSNMKDFLTDIVAHTYVLGDIDMVKVTGDDNSTELEAVAKDKSVVIKAAFHKPSLDFKGTYGMPNLGKLNIILNIPEYKENSKFSLVKEQRNGDTVPTGLHFENEKGDFVNDYRFMSMEAVNEKLKSLKFKGVAWHVTFEPSIAAIQRLRFQAQANSEETTFIAKTEKGDLKFYFGDHSTHAGNFVFHAGIQGSLNKAWSWPVNRFISILQLDGDKTVQISDEGAAVITVDSGLVKYEYILLAQSK
jgi:hypothetical protein